MLARVSKCGEIVGRERSCFLRGVSSRHIFVVHRSISSCPGLVMCDGWSVLRIIFSSIFVRN